MAKSSATSVQAYLDELPEERRAVVSAVRDTILRHLPAGYQETINWGMISYEIPLERYPRTYNGQPLSYIALAAQKNYYVLHLTAFYADTTRHDRLMEAFARAGKKFDMGKGCLRFRKLDDVPWEAVGELVASASPDQYIAVYEAARTRS
jgi:hypothetical protein